VLFFCSAPPVVRTCCGLYCVASAIYDAHDHGVIVFLITSLFSNNIITLSGYRVKNKKTIFGCSAVSSEIPDEWRYAAGCRVIREGREEINEEFNIIEINKNVIFFFSHACGGVMVVTIILNTYVILL